MRVAILGGYGVFGSRLAELLVRDGHDVWLVGRDRGKAEELAGRIGSRLAVIDCRTEPERIFDLAPEAVVDAAGPFQAYDGDPYRIPRLCIERGVDYLDLSDDADFTAGLSALDEAARKSGRRILSGASSVPGLSSVAAAELGRGFDEILLIDTAILPGNRAPRGRSVIASILSQLGATTRIWRGGMWRQQRCWTDARRIRLAPDLVRTARYIEVPDIRLFPAFFRARSVIFRAGMELPVLNAAMIALGGLRRLWRFDVTPRRAEVVRRIAALTQPLGTDRGGMRVLVVGREGASVRRREWRLVAEAGSGPFVPAIVARALLRRMRDIAPGARPCLAETTLAAIDAASSDLPIATRIEEGEAPMLFQSALADRWAMLPPELRELHGVQDMESFSGAARVERGTSLLARLAGWFFGFPQAGENVPVTVTKTRTGDGETWERNFDGRVFRSYCTPADTPYRYRERFWLFDYEQDLPVEDGSMRLPVRRGWFAGLPLLRALLPGSDSREYVRDEIFHFDVALSVPLGGGLIVRYRGWLKPDRSDAVHGH